MGRSSALRPGAAISLTAPTRATFILDLPSAPHRQFRASQSRAEQIRGSSRTAALCDHLRCGHHRHGDGKAVELRDINNGTGDRRTGLKSPTP